jgi:hypothetical protein
MAPAPSSPPASFWSSARIALVGVAFVLPALALPVLGAACADAASAGGTGSGGGGAGDVVGTGVGGVESDATVPDTQPDVQPPSFADLCGEGPCLPGDVDACAGGIEGGRFRGLATLGCHVVVDEEGNPASACELAGTGAIDAPCQTSGDCQPGSSCIPTENARDTSAGVCRPYCCGDVEECPTADSEIGASYCAPRTRVEDPETEVPVCVAVTPCGLLDDDGACPPSTTCSVVRNDGTTSCVIPGDGLLCEPCPCAEGFVCAVHTGLCQKLCRTDGSDDECGTVGFCQGGSSGYPPGFGVCVGGENACEDG